MTTKKRPLSKVSKNCCDIYSSSPRNNLYIRYTHVHIFFYRLFFSKFKVYIPLYFCNKLFFYAQNCYFSDLLRQDSNEMYRKRARAAHVLQPAAGGVTTSTAPSGAATQEQVLGSSADAAAAASGQLYGNSQIGYSNSQASAATQPPVQFFNPMTYQNGYVGGDQQYAGDIQQHSADGGGQQGFNHSTQQYSQPSLNSQG